MTVEIIRGSEADLYRYSARVAAESDRVLCLAKAPDDYRSWCAVRGLLEQLRSRLPAGLVEEVVVRHRPAASLVLHELEERLSPQERALRGAFASQLTSHMTHNWMLHYPLLEAWAALLVDLTAGRNFTILVPNLALIAWEDAATLKSIYRRFEDRAPHVILGINPAIETPADENGIIWPFSASRCLHFIQDFQALSGTETRDLPPQNGDGDLALAELLRKAVPATGPGDLEVRAFKALRSASEPIEPASSRLVVEATRATFRCFGETTAMRLGLELLAKRPALDDLEAADVHTIVGLAAHNRQFLSGDAQLAFADFLEHHYTAALAVERRPTHRCALLYRLAVTRGRRKKDFKAGLEWADRAISEAQAAARTDLPPLQVAYQEVWARNIRAYALMRLGRLDEAAAETRAGFAGIDRALAEVADPSSLEGDEAMWLLDAQSSHSLLAYNTYGLSMFMREPPEVLESWLKKARAAIAAVPGVERFEADAWIRLHLKTLRLDFALARARSGLASARRERDARMEYNYLVLAADLTFRRGEARRAYELFEEVQRLRRQLRLPRSAAMDLISASARAHAGLLDEARASLQEARSAEANRSVDAQAQILACLAVIAAKRGDTADVDASIDRAIELALDSGERNTLLRVAAASGYACQILHRLQEAGEAYEKALEIAQAGDDGATPPPASDLLSVLVGFQECKGPEPELARRSLKLLPKALEDPDTWWELARLLKILRAVHEASPGIFDSTDLSKPLEKLVAAARQRADCSAPLSGLFEVLPSSQRALESS